MPNDKTKTITGHGLVDKLSNPQKSSGGKTFYWVTINGIEYSVWDADLIGAFAPGYSVQFEYQVAGKYKNIVSVESDGDRPQAGGQSTPKDELIVRQTCIKAAAELVNPMEDDYEQAAQVVTTMAEVFEEWVWRKKTDEPPEPEED